MCDSPRFFQSDGVRYLRPERPGRRIPLCVPRPVYATCASVLRRHFPRVARQHTADWRLGVEHIQLRQHLRRVARQEPRKRTDAAAASASAERRGQQEIVTTSGRCHLAVTHRPRFRELSHLGAPLPVEPHRVNDVLTHEACARLLDTEGGNVPYVFARAVSSEPTNAEVSHLLYFFMRNWVKRSIAIHPHFTRE